MNVIKKQRIVNTSLVLTIIGISLMVAILSSSCVRYSPVFPERSASYYDEVYEGIRSLAEQDSLSAIAKQDTVKWNEFIRLTHLPGEGGDASCDSIWCIVYGYSLEWK